MAGEIGIEGLVDLDFALGLDDSEAEVTDCEKDEAAKAGDVVVGIESGEDGFVGSISSRRSMGDNGCGCCV